MSGQYPSNWRSIAQEKKASVGWCCERCKESHDPGRGYCLTVHHIDMDKSNCEWWNLVALCQRCHLTIQARVDIHQQYMFDHADWFQKYVNGRKEAESTK